MGNKKTARIAWTVGAAILFLPFALYGLTGIYAWLFFGIPVDIERVPAALFIALFTGMIFGLIADFNDVWRAR